MSKDLIQYFSQTPNTTMSDQVNEQTGEISALSQADRRMMNTAPTNAFSIPKREGILLPHNPRDYRCMVEKDKGYFTSNDRNVGSKIQFSLLNWKEVHNVKFSDLYEQPETVIQCVIVDSDNVIGTIVIRTWSMQGFLSMLDDVFANELAYGSVLVTAEMEKIVGKKFTYHIVKFTYEEMTDQRVLEIMQFIESVPEAANVFREVPTV
jgi:hypothetical protein